MSDRPSQGESAPQATYCSHLTPVVRRLRGSVPTALDPPPTPHAPDLSCSCGLPRLVIEVVLDPEAHVLGVAVALIADGDASPGHGAHAVRPGPTSGPRNGSAGTLPMGKNFSRE